MNICAHIRFHVLEKRGAEVILVIDLEKRNNQKNINCSSSKTFKWQSQRVAQKVQPRREERHVVGLICFCATLILKEQGNYMWIVRELTTRLHQTFICELLLQFNLFADF
ncbi:hypothetical protein ACJX0J_011107, partial [Zea mays]